MKNIDLADLTHILNELFYEIPYFTDHLPSLPKMLQICRKLRWYYWKHRVI